MTVLFFDFGTGEIFLIVLAIFLVFGPGKIPELARGLGKFINEIKRASEDVKEEINREANRIEREKKLEKYKADLSQKENIEADDAVIHKATVEGNDSHAEATEVADEVKKADESDTKESETISIKPAEKAVSTKR